MFLMMAEVLELHRVAAAKPGGGFWQFLAHHQTLVEWIGCSLHVLIQPSFSFLVSAALPFSQASRTGRGAAAKRTSTALHALCRALILILLGVFLRSIGRQQTNWTFEDTLTQIGLGYGILYLLGMCPVRDQWLALGTILLGFWAAFALFPLPGIDFDYSKVGVPAAWPHLMTGFAAHWNKNSNLAWSCEHRDFRAQRLGLSSCCHRDELNCAYCMAHLFEGFIAQSIATHFGKGVFKMFGDTYESLVRGSFVLLTYWLILFWMYRRKIFLRI
jgi:predicted acyltransferase